jgi:hypothetical protein
VHHADFPADQHREVESYSVSHQRQNVTNKYLLHSNQSI